MYILSKVFCFYKELNFLSIKALKQNTTKKIYLPNRSAADRLIFFF